MRTREGREREGKKRREKIEGKGKGWEDAGDGGGRERAERYGLTNMKTMFPVEVDLNQRPFGFSLVPPILPIIKIDFCKNPPHRCTGKRYHGIEKAYDPQ